MFNLIAKALAALKAGKQLENVEDWKNKHATTNDIFTVLVFVVGLIRYKFPDVLVSDDILLAIAAGIGTILGAINSYFTRATTRKIGL